MSYTPGAETDPFSDSAARHNGDLPQGLKSSPYDPTIPNPNYPHLGFNPVPGSPDTVRALSKKLGNCAKVLEETHGLVTKLMEGSYWKGDAAVAFREQLDGGPLPLNLKNAAHSVRKAARLRTTRQRRSAPRLTGRSWVLSTGARPLISCDARSSEPAGGIVPGIFQ
ncbi:WXG100 family type VII secretion target [Streptomyces sp. NPDC005302]|uniref:WXG100 family type VII secretion target n=1 Tax=Streptomyces sp. NPDC005302 TaxID=3154675 RepID=UPI0033B3F0D7